MENEIWRPVLGYENHYEVSNLGNVRSLMYKGGRHIHPIHQTLKPSGYYEVMLTENKKNFYKPVHRLVAQAFVPNPNNYSDIDHISRNSLDNRLVNLRWASRKMNMANENTRKILNICHKGADHSYRWRPVIRMKDGDILQYYKSITEATKEGYDGHNITQVCRGQKKTHRGYQWVYADEYKGEITSLPTTSGE